MQRRNRDIVIFNLSAIDLFCSGMGAVMVLMVLLMPYYRKQDPAPESNPPQPVPDPVVVVEPQPPKPEPPKPEEKGLKVLAIDVVFVMDATMSMEEELDSTRRNMTTIIQVLRRLSDDVHVGYVAYIDRAVPWTIPLRSVAKGPIGERNHKLLIEGMKKVQLVGNQDWPEHVYGGLSEAAKMRWQNGEDRRQLIILIGDARTHPEDRRASIDLVGNWSGRADKNRGVHAVFTPPTDFPNEPHYLQEIRASKAYFQDIAKSGKGEFFDETGDLLGSILDILIVR